MGQEEKEKLTHLNGRLHGEGREGGAGASGTCLPRDIGLPAPPGFAQVLQDGPGLVLLDPLGHHVQDIVHHCRPQLQVKVGLYPLLGDSLGHPL